MGQLSTHVQAISKSRPTTHPSAYKSRRRQATQSGMNPGTHKSYASKVKNPSTESMSKQCYKCGKQHSSRDSCTAQDQRCSFCHKWNHFASVWRSRFQYWQSFIKIKLGLNKKEVKFKIDTGSQVNIFPETFYNDLAPQYSFSKSKIKLFAYNGHSVLPIGYSVIQSNLKGMDYSTEYQVVETHYHTISGLRACFDFGIVHLTYSIDKEIPYCNSDVLNQYSVVFHAGKCTFQVDPKVLKLRLLSTLHAKYL